MFISKAIKNNVFFLSTLQDFIKAEPADSLRSPVRHLVMTTCANLMYPLLHFIQQDFLNNLFKSLYHSFNLPTGVVIKNCLWLFPYMVWSHDHDMIMSHQKKKRFFNLKLTRHLEPALSENESFDLLKVCVNSVFSLPPDTHTPEKTKEDDVLDPKKRKVK